MKIKVFQKRFEDALFKALEAEVDEYLYSKEELINVLLDVFEVAVQNERTIESAPDDVQAVARERILWRHPSHSSLSASMVASSAMWPFR